MSGITSVLATVNLGTTEVVTLKTYGDGTVEFTPKTVTTGTRTSGSPNLGSVASTLGVSVGNPISGTGIPAGTTVLSFVADTSIVMSANASSGSATSTALTITKTRNGLGNRTDSAAAERAWLAALFVALGVVA